LKSINDIKVGTVDKVDYSATKTEVFASGEWHINFATNSSEILSSSYADLETIYNLMVQAENSKITIVGHSDNTGTDAINTPLSKERAMSVFNHLKDKGIQASRFQDVDGKGSSEPLADNSTAAGKAKNRRVTITFLK
jgi:outer membrane protein OmpA-like peptidoglycan-associated protein